MSGSMVAALFVLVFAAAGESEPVSMKILLREGEVRIDGQVLGRYQWKDAVSGAQVTLKPGSMVWLACPDGRCRELRDSANLGAATCAEKAATPCCRQDEGGSRLILGGEKGNEIGAAVEACGEDWAYAALGRGLLLGQARGEVKSWGHDPILLSPRCPEEGPSISCGKHLRPPPDILFAEIAAARRYAIDLLGPDGARLPIEVGQLDCRPWPALPGRVCRLPWPAEWRLPEPGRKLGLILRVADSFEVRSSETNYLTSLPSAAAAELQAALADAERKKPPEALHEQVSLLLAAGLYGELAALLRKSSESGDPLTSPLELALATAYLHLDLAELAEFHFQRVRQRMLPDQVGLLANEACLGLGLSALVLGRFAEAAESFAAAAAGFAALGLSERADEARALLERARAAAH